MRLLRFREILGDMRDGGGTVRFFGASPGAGDFAFESGKDATRGVARSLADEYGDVGIHIAHVVIDGSLLNPDLYENEGDVIEEEYIDPTAAAETCYHSFNSPTVHGRSNSTSTRTNGPALGKRFRSEQAVTCTDQFGPDRFR